MDSNAVSNIVMTQFTSSAVVVWLMQKLKSASWFPFLQHGRATVSRLFSIGVAFFVAIGIGYTWNTNSSGIHTLTLTIPGLWGLAVGVWHWLNQFVLQETVYQATVNKISVTTQPVLPVTMPGIDATGAVVLPKPADK